MYYKLSECYTVFYSICFVGVFLYNLQQVVEIPIKKNKWQTIDILVF